MLVLPDVVGLWVKRATNEFKIFAKAGAEYIAADVVRFRLWATGQQRLFSGLLRVRPGKCRRAVTAGLRWTSPGRGTGITLYSAMAWVILIRFPRPKTERQRSVICG